MSIPQLPWPGERITEFGALHFDEAGEVRFTGRSPWQLSSDRPEPGAINLMAGDFFWGRSKPPKMLRRDDIIGSGFWVFTALAVTPEILEMEIEVSFGFAAAQEGMAEATEPVWGPPQAIRFTSTGRAVAVLPREHLDYDVLMSADEEYFSAFRVEVIVGEGPVSEMVLQLEPPGGMQEITGTETSEWVQPDPITKEVQIGFEARQVAIVSESATTFTGVFENEALDDAVQAGAAVTRTGGNKTDAGENHLASPYFSGYQYAGGFVNVTNAGGTGPHPVDTRLIVKYLGSQDIHELEETLEVPPDLLWDKDTSPTAAMEGRDWVNDGSSEGVEWDATEHTTFLGWLDSEWVWTRASNYSTSYVSVIAGTFDEIFFGGFSDGTVQPHGVYDGPMPPADLDYTVLATTPPGPTFPNTPFTIYGADLPWGPFGALQFALVLWDQTMTGAPLPVGTPRSWTIQIDRDNAAEVGSSNIPYQYQLPDFKYQIPLYGPHPLRVTAFDLDREYTGNVPLVLPTASDSGAGEYMFSNVVLFTEPPPTPSLWFVYKRSGFAGNTFTVYGFGLGATKAELGAKLWLELGSVAGGTFEVSRFEPETVTWRNNPDLVHAYDGTGVIFPGSNVAVPNVDMECQVIEFVVPATLDILGPTAYNLYVTTRYGQSNRLDLMVYKQADFSMGVDEPLLGTNTVGLGTYSPKEWPADGTVPPDGYFIGLPGPDGVIPGVAGFNYNVLVQRYSRVVTSYVLTGRIPERPPTYLTEAKPAFALTGGAATTALDDPVTVALPLPLRYRPLDSKRHPAPRPRHRDERLGLQRDLRLRTGSSTTRARPTSTPRTSSQPVRTATWSARRWPSPATPGPS